MPRRPMIAVIGDAGVKPRSIAYERVLKLGKLCETRFCLLMAV